MSEFPARAPIHRPLRSEQRDTGDGTHLAGFSDGSDVRVQVGRMRVELHEEHTDVVQQWLASVRVLHGGQLPQVTQLKTPGLSGGKHTVHVCSISSAQVHDTELGHKLTLHPLRKLPMANTVARIYLKVWLADSCSMASLRWKRGSAISCSQDGHVLESRLTADHHQSISAIGLLPNTVLTLPKPQK